MTIPSCDYNPADWLRKINQCALDALAHHGRPGEENYRALADKAREIQDYAKNAEQKAITFWKGEAIESALRIETISQDAVFNEGRYNEFCAEARQKKLEIVMLIEVQGGGYRGPAVILKEEPKYMKISGDRWGHPLFSMATLRRKFNDGWALYPGTF